MKIKKSKDKEKRAKDLESLKEILNDIREDIRCIDKIQSSAPKALLDKIRAEVDEEFGVVKERFFEEDDVEYLVSKLPKERVRKGDDFGEGE